MRSRKAELTGLLNLLDLLTPVLTGFTEMVPGVFNKNGILANLTKNDESWRVIVVGGLKTTSTLRVTCGPSPCSTETGAGF